MGSRGHGSRSLIRGMANGVEEEDFWNRAMPGMHMALKFPDDDVWHEMSFLWGLPPATGVVYSPDEDLYTEYLFGGDGAVQKQ